MRGTPIPLDLAVDGYLQTPDGHIRHICDLGNLIRFGSDRGISWWWGELESDGYSLIGIRAILLSPRIVTAPPFYVRRVIRHEIAHCLSGSASEELARGFALRAVTEPEEPVIRYGPELILTDDLLEMVWRQHGMEYLDVEELADAEGVTIREACLGLLVEDDWLMAA